MINKDDLLLFDDYVIVDDDRSLRIGEYFLIIGKGPTFNKYKKIREEMDFEEERGFTYTYETIGLNHVAEKVKVDFMHFIDLDVTTQVDFDKVNENAEFILAPHIINENFRPGRYITDVIEDNKLLYHFYKEERLWVYNRYEPNRYTLGRGKLVKPVNFSGDTVYQLLSELGEKEIYSYGLDGGVSYDPSFGMKPLTNGQPSFDSQMNVIDYFSQKNGSKLIKL